MVYEMIEGNMIKPAFEIPELRIIIAGSREYDGYYRLRTTCMDIITHDLNGVLYLKHNKLQIVSGHCPQGADKYGEMFSTFLHLNPKLFPAQWNRYGKRAGMVRNEEMAIYASSDYNVGVLIAFWDGKSTGTENMINNAYKYGLKVFVINYKEKQQIQRRII